MAVNKVKSRVWEFGRFRLDEAERLLARDGVPVGLTPKVFDTLVALVERNGHLVEKDELMTRLWPDTFVEEGALTRNISDLRKALGGEKYVETVPKRGYRFVAAVREIDCAIATLIVEKTTEARLVIEEEEVTQSDTANNYLSQPPFAPFKSEVADKSGVAEPPATGTASAISLAAQHQTTRPRWRLKTRLAVILGLSLLFAGSALALRQFFASRTPADQARSLFQAMQVSRFTASGNILTATVSPDGKYMATAVDEGGLQSLWVRQVAANTSSIRLIQPAMVDYWGLTFSNDSNFIYYVSWVRNQPDAELYQLPVLGGTPRKLSTGIDTPISFSPAGDRFAYVTSSSSKGESYVKVAGVEGSDGHTLVNRYKPGFFAAWPGGPAWSPNGNVIAYAATSSVEESGQRVHVFVASAEDKRERQLTEQAWRTVGRVAWLSDGSGLVISA